MSTYDVLYEKYMKEGLSEKNADIAAFSLVVRVAVADFKGQKVTIGDWTVVRGRRASANYKDRPIIETVAIFGTAREAQAYTDEYNAVSDGWFYSVDRQIILS